MAYTTRKDLAQAAGGVESLVQLADWDGDGLSDEEAIAAAQVKADGLIDSYAAIRYKVPIQRPSGVLVQMAADETIFQLLVRRGQAGREDREDRDLRVQWLEALAAGKVRPSDPPPAKSSGVVNRYRRSRRAVSRRKLKGFW